MKAVSLKVLCLALVSLPVMGLAQQVDPKPAEATPTTQAPAATVPATTVPQTEGQPVPAVVAPAVGSAPTDPAATASGQASSAATPLPAGSPLQLSPTYVIGSDDNIQVTVWHEPTLSGTFPVRPDGMISIALVGDILASGRTPMQLSDDLSVRLKKFVNDPTVSVTVLAVNSKRVFMLGEIAHIGPISLTSDMSPLQAIATAGGLSVYANKSKIYILRTVNGKQTKLPFDYKKAIKTGDVQGLKLLPGDTIVVP